MNEQFLHIRRTLKGQPLAITEAGMNNLTAFLMRRLNGNRLSKEEIAQVKGRRMPNGTLMRGDAGSLAGLIAAFEDDDLAAQTVYARAATPASEPAPGSLVAVVNVAGIIHQRAAEVDDFCGPGGTSTERVGQAVDAAAADPAVRGIALNIYSPGGGVFGVEEVTKRIAAAAKRKPVIAQVGSMACSAAYWMASAASEIVMAPSAVVGSIGVYALHEDVSGAAEKAGLRFTFVANDESPFKVEGNPYEALGEEARAAIHADVQGYYRDFVAAVAAGRGVTMAKVVADFGKGRTMRAKDAIAAGMADRVGELGDTLRRLATAKPETIGRRAMGGAVVIGAGAVAPALAATAPAAPPAPPEPPAPPAQVEDPEAKGPMPPTEPVEEHGEAAPPADPVPEAPEGAQPPQEAQNEGGGTDGPSIQAPEASSSGQPDRAAEEANRKALDSDAFRRRRHAARLRGV